MENYDKDILIIVPTTSLVNQMYGDFADYSEFDQAFSAEDSCHMIYSGKEKNPGKKIEYKITLDNGEVLTAKADDKIKLTTGKKIKACELNENDEVCDQWLKSLTKS